MVFYLFFVLKYHYGDVMHIKYNEKEYPVFIIKKNNKNLYIKVDTDLNIKITCPYFYTKKMINKVIEDNINSIYKMIDKQSKKNEIKKQDDNKLLSKKINIIYKPVKTPFYDGDNLIVKDSKMLSNWYKNMAKNIFAQYLDELYYLFEEKIPYPSLKIRLMKTRWGVCNRKNNCITLNLELIRKDSKFLKYVIIHELSHFVHFNHGKDFWKLVSKYCKDYKEIRKELK